MLLTRSHVHVLGTVVLGMFFALSTRTRAANLPNFVIIFTDDLGYGDLGCYGARQISTPNLDRMAAEGTRLTDFHVQPVCGVSRAALMTGCYLAWAKDVDSGVPALAADVLTSGRRSAWRAWHTLRVGNHFCAGRGTWM